MSLRVECNASIYQIVIFNDSYIHDLLQKMLVIMSVALLKLNLVHKTCSQWKEKEKKNGPTLIYIVFCFDSLF
jgi:hypothetical protein